MKRDIVKNAAVDMVREAGLINLSRRGLCERAGIPDGSFPYTMGCSFAEFVEELKAEGIESAVFPVSKSRANPVLRKESILAVAVELSRENGYQRVTRDAIAEGAGVSMSLVTRYFGTMVKLRRDIMRHAIREGVVEIVAQGLAAGDGHARKAPAELKERAASLLANA